MLGIKAPDPHVEQVFTELVDTYQTSLLRMCYLNLQDIGLAEDAVQETFIKAYRALSSFRNESNLKTWLMKIAINTCRDFLQPLPVSGLISHDFHSPFQIGDF